MILFAPCLRLLGRYLFGDLLAGSEPLIRWTAVVSYFLCLWYLFFEDGPHVVEDAFYKYRGCFVCLPFFYDASFSAVPLGPRKVGRFPTMGWLS